MAGLQNRLGEITGLTAAIVLIIAAVSKWSPGPLPYTTSVIIVFVSLVRILLWRWSKISLEKPLGIDLIEGGSAQKLLSQKPQYRLLDIINPATKTVYQLSYRRRCLEFVALVVFTILSIVWTFTSLEDIKREIMGVPPMICTRSISDSGLTILIARFNQTAGTSSLIEERTLDAVASHLVDTMRVCLVEQVVSTRIDAQNLAESVQAAVVVWGRIDAVFEVNLEVMGGAWSNRPVFRLASGDVLDNYSFQLDSSEDINLVTAFAISQSLYGDNRIKDARILLGGALSTAENRGIAQTNPAIMVEPYVFLGFLFDKQYNGTAASNANLDESIKAYSRAIELDPAYYTAYLNRAFAFKEAAEETDKATADDLIAHAIADYRLLIDTPSPFVIESLVSLAEIYIAKGDRNSAEEEFTKAINYDSQDPKGYISRGIAYLWSWDEPAKAVLDFESALKLAPEEPDRYHDLGQAQLLAGQTSAAIQTYLDARPFLTSDEIEEEIIPELDELVEETPDLQLQQAVETIKKDLIQR